VPDGSEASAWNNWKYPKNRQYVFSIQSDGNGECEYDVKTEAGTYEVRCYLMIHRPADEVPEFPLLAIGKIIIAPQAASDSTDSGSSGLAAQPVAEK
jgi:hypothetical protein